MASGIDTPSKRARLSARKNPYWQGISGGRGGVSLGYRKGRAAGAWVAKLVLAGQRLEERLGDADDDASGPTALSYRGAVEACLAWSKRQHAALEARAEAGTASRSHTVRTAVEAYGRARELRSPVTGKNASGRLARHVLSDSAFAELALSKLRARHIEDWRERAISAEVERTSKVLSAATVNRLLSDLRAALNAAAEAHRRELPPHLLQEIRVGTRALALHSTARKQILSDDEIRKLVDAAFAVDDTGDFGRLILVAATTGARFSQIARITVEDLQLERARLLVPASRKGRSARAKAPVAVPLSAGVIDRLRDVSGDRDADEPLLMRWAYRRAGRLKWERDRRRGWGPAYEVDKYWSLAVAKAELPPSTLMYALRHSSIVRGLKVGLPVRLVAAMHDTSSEMVELHYSAFIVDASHELSRRAALAI